MAKRTALSFSQKKRRRRIKIFILLVVLGILVWGMRRFILTAPYFQIKEIAVQGNNRLAAKQILDWANIPLERSIFTLNLKEITQEIASKSRIKRVEIKRVLPANILILVEERLPFAYLARDKNFFEVCEDGVIIKKREDSMDLPVIEVDSSFPLEAKLTREVRILRTAQELGIPFSRLDVKNRQEQVGLLERGVKVYLGKGDHLDYFSYLPSLLETSRKKGKDIKYIDLRFNNQIVVKEK